MTVTNTRNGIPGLDKTSAPADGVAQVAPGDLINYSVTVSNTGGLPITGPVVDTLPAGLTVVPTTITGGGTRQRDDHGDHLAGGQPGTGCDADLHLPGRGWFRA